MLLAQLAQFCNISSQNDSLKAFWTRFKPQYCNCLSFLCTLTTDPQEPGKKIQGMYDHND